MIEEISYVTNRNLDTSELTKKLDTNTETHKLNF